MFFSFVSSHCVLLSGVESSNFFIGVTEMHKKSPCDAMFFSCRSFHFGTSTISRPVIVRSREGGGRGGHRLETVRSFSARECRGGIDAQGIFTALVASFQK